MLGEHRPDAVMSSPGSSDEGASRHDSPETKLTALSPEDGRMMARKNSGSGAIRMDQFNSFRSM